MTALGRERSFASLRYRPRAAIRRLPARHRLPEDDARRAACLDHLAGGGELAAARLHAERHDRVAVHVRGVEHRARRLDGDKTRRLAPRRLPADWAERTVRLVDGKDGEAVVPTVGRIDKAARGRHYDLRCRAVAGEARRQRRDDLERRERTALAVE